jgi:uncharacterized repeat protein (TIGR01451 family)/LPXTG-motif cell wall-anchored protein
LALDAAGTFAAGNLGSYSGAGGPASSLRLPGSVSLRGSGPGTCQGAPDTQYPWLAGAKMPGVRTGGSSAVGASATTADIGYRTVRISVQPGTAASGATSRTGGPTVTVWMTPVTAAGPRAAAPTGFTQVLSTDLSSVAGQVATPPTLRLGFGASTGAAVADYHDIRNIVVTANADLSATAGLSTRSGRPGLPAGVFHSGDPISFTLGGFERGPAGLAGSVTTDAHITADLSRLPLRNISYRCSATQGARCLTSGGRGPNIDVGWIGPAGSSARVSVAAVVSGSPGKYPLTATVALPPAANVSHPAASFAAVTDLNPADDTATTSFSIVATPPVRAGASPPAPQTPSKPASGRAGVAVPNDVPADPPPDPLFVETKSADATSYIVGQPITYTLTVTNNGAGDGTATVSDDVPATVDVTGQTCVGTGTAATCDTAGSTGNSVAGTMSVPAGQTVTYTVSGTVVAAGSVANTATVSPTNSDCSTQCGGGAASTAALSAAANPVFSSTKTADATSYVVGQPITYTVSVVNGGAGEGTATLTDQVPPTVQVTSVSCAASGTATCDTSGTSGNAVSGSMDLPAGDSADYTIAGVVVRAGPVTNSASVTPTTSGCSNQCGGGPAATGPLDALDAPMFTQTKTADRTSYVVGEPIIYTVTVANTGLGDGTASISDPIPATVSATEAACTGTGGTTCSATLFGTGLVTANVSIPAGQSAVLTISGTAASAGDAENIATVTPTTAGCTNQCGGGTADSGTLPVLANPQFSVTKTADQTAYIVGQPITYTVTVVNSGSGGGTATLSDAVPARVTVTGESCVGTGAATCDTLSSSGNSVAGSMTVPAGESVTYTITGTVASAGSVANTATVAPTTPGCSAQCGGGQAGTGPLTALAAPTFTVTKTADRTGYIVGQPVTYTITVTNTGSGPGTAIIADTAPVSVSVGTVTCTPGGMATCTAINAGNTISGSVGIPSGGNVVFTVDGTAAAIGDAQNTATVTPTTAGCSTQCGGGSASTPSLPVSGAPLFTETKTADQTSYITGQAITYTITVTNAGNGAGQATISDAIPTTVSGVAVSCTPTALATCDTTGSSGNTLSGHVVLPASASATFTVTGAVKSAGSVANTATVTPTTTGCSTQCGGGAASTGPLVALGNPVFTQVKTADSNAYILGQAIVYTITVRNTGAGPGTASLADSVNPRVAVTSVSCTASTGASCDTAGSVGNAVSGSMTVPAGGSVVYTIAGSVQLAGSVVNLATVTPTTPGCSTQCGGGNISTDPITASNNPQFTETKVADQTSYLVGEPITYTITVHNAGGGSGDASVTDSVPTTVSVSAVSCAPTSGATCSASFTGQAVSAAATMAGGSSVQVIVTGAVTHAGDVSNVASVKATTAGCTNQCGGGPASTGPLDAVDNPMFTMVKSADATSYQVGDPIEYTIVVDNAGLGAGTAALTDSVPSLVSVQTVTCAPGAGAICSVVGRPSNTVSGEVSIPPGGTVVFTVTGFISATGDAQNTALLNPSGTVAGGTPGCVSQCGGGPASTPSLPADPTADLSVTTSLNHGQSVAGLPISFSVAVNNGGPNDATDVLTVDPVPAAIERPVGTPDASIPGGTCATRPTTGLDLEILDPRYGPYSVAAYPQVVQCEYPALATGGVVHETVSGIVNPASRPGTVLHNQVFAAGSTFDPSLDDNLAIASATVKGVADLALSMTSGSAKVQIGTDVTFSFSVVNHGPSTPQDVVVVNVPTGLAAQAASASQGAFSLSSGRWSVGALAAGATATLRLTERVTAIPAYNSATVSAAGYTDPEHPDNTAVAGCESAQAACAAAVGSVDVSSPVSASASLPFTGSQDILAAWIGVGLLATGGAVLVLARRRRT